MDHFSYGRGCGCHHGDERDYYPRRVYCKGGCGRIRPEWKHEWCKHCRKTDAYAEHLRRIEAWKEETKGMTTVEVFAHQMKKAYSKEFFDAFEKNSVEHTGLQ